MKRKWYISTSYSNFLVLVYLAAIILANLLVARYGPMISVVNAFLFIGLDLSSRDALHERWGGKMLWAKMLALISAGSMISFLLNRGAGQIAIASLLAFAGAGIADTVAYSMLVGNRRLVKMNVSNLVSAAVDSLVFPVVAFGLPPLWMIVAGQFAAKVFGGFIWSLVLAIPEKR